MVSLESFPFLMPRSLFALSFSPSSPLDRCAERQEEKRSTSLTSTLDRKKTKNSPQLQFDVLCSSGSSRVVAGGVASSRPDLLLNLLFFLRVRVLRRGALLQGPHGALLGLRRHHEEIHLFGEGGGCRLLPLLLRFDSSSSSSSSSTPTTPTLTTTTPTATPAAPRAPPTSPWRSSASPPWCRLRPGAAAVECPLDRGGRDRAWRLPRGLRAPALSHFASSSAAPVPAPVVLSHPMEEPATLPAIRYAEGRGRRCEEDEAPRQELGDLGGESVLFVGRLSSPPALLLRPLLAASSGTGSSCGTPGGLR